MADSLILNEPTGKDSIKGGIFFGNNLTPAGTFTNVPVTSSVAPPSKAQEATLILSLQQIKDNIIKNAKEQQGTSEDPLSEESVNTFLTTFVQLLIDYRDLRNVVFFGSSYTELTYQINFLIENYPFKSYFAKNVAGAGALNPISITSSLGVSTIRFKIDDVLQKANYQFDDSGKTQWLDYNLVDTNGTRFPITNITFDTPLIIPVANASNTTEILITTTVPHGLLHGDYVTVEGVLGNNDANGKYLASPTLPSTPITGVSLGVIILGTQYRVITPAAILGPVITGPGALNIGQKYITITPSVHDSVNYVSGDIFTATSASLTSGNVEPYYIQGELFTGDGISVDLESGQVSSSTTFELVGSAGSGVAIPNSGQFTTQNIVIEATGTINVNNLVEHIPVAGDTFKGLIISPKIQDLNNFDISLDGIKETLLSTANPTPWPRDPVTENIKTEGEEYEKWIEDPANMSSGYDVEDMGVVSIEGALNLLGAATLDETITNQLVRRAIPNQIIDELRDTDDKFFTRFILLAGKMFDTIKVYIDFLKYTKTLNYGSFNQLSPDFYRVYAEHYGFDLYDDENVDLAQALVTTEPGLSYNNLSQAVFNDTANSKTIKELQSEKQKRLLLNLFYLFQTKGTQECIKRLVKLLGAPEGLVLLEEYAFDQTDGSKIVDNDKIKVPQISYEIDLDYLVDKTNINNPVNLPYVYKLKLDTDSTVNLREMSGFTDPQGAIHSAIVTYGKNIYAYGKYGTGGYSTLQNYRNPDGYFMLPLSFPDKYSGITVEYMLPRNAYPQKVGQGFDEVSVHLGSLYEAADISYDISVVPTANGTQIINISAGDVNINTVVVTTAGNPTLSFTTEFTTLAAGESQIARVYINTSGTVMFILGAAVLAPAVPQPPLLPANTALIADVTLIKDSNVVIQTNINYNLNLKIPSGTQFFYPQPPAFCETVVINNPTSIKGYGVIKIIDLPTPGLSLDVVVNGSIIGSTDWKVSAKLTAEAIADSINFNYTTPNFSAYVSQDPSSLDYSIKIVAQNASNSIIGSPISVDTNTLNDLVNIELVQPTITNNPLVTSGKQFIIARVEGKDLVVRLKLRSETLSPAQPPISEERVAILENFFTADGLNHLLRLVYRPEGVEVYQDFKFISLIRWRDPLTVFKNSIDILNSEITQATFKSIPELTFGYPDDEGESLTGPSVPTIDAGPTALIIGANYRAVTLAVSNAVNYPIGTVFTATVTSLTSGSVQLEITSVDTRKWWDLFIGLPVNIDIFFKRIAVFESLTINQTDTLDFGIDLTGENVEKYSFDFSNQSKDPNTGEFLTNSLQVPAEFRVMSPYPAGQPNIPLNPIDDKFSSYPGNLVTDLNIVTGGTTTTDLIVDPEASLPNYLNADIDFIQDVQNFFKLPSGITVTMDSLFNYNAWSPTIHKDYIYTNYNKIFANYEAFSQQVLLYTSLLPFIELIEGKFRRLVEQFIPIVINMDKFGRLVKAQTPNKVHYPNIHTQCAGTSSGLISSSGFRITHGTWNAYSNIDNNLNIRLEVAKFISGATNTSPIAITNQSVHNLTSGASVVISGVNGNTAANGTFFVNVTSPLTYELYSDLALTTPVTGNGVYTGGGETTITVLDLGTYTWLCSNVVTAEAVVTALNLLFPGNIIASTDLNAITILIDPNWMLTNYSELIEDINLTVVPSSNVSVDAVFGFTEGFSGVSGSDCFVVTYIPTAANLLGFKEVYVHYQSELALKDYIYYETEITGQGPYIYI